MNATILSSFSMLTFFSWAVVQAEVPPAWMADDFIMEEVVVTAEAPASFYMEEIVVTAEAPAHLYMEEIVVTAKLSDVEPASEGTHASVSEDPNAGRPVMEEIVVTASMDEVRSYAARHRGRRERRLF